MRVNLFIMLQRKNITSFQEDIEYLSLGCVKRFKKKIQRELLLGG